MTLKVMSRAGRITMAGHIMTIVRNILGDDAANGVGRIRLMQENGDEVCLRSLYTHFMSFHIHVVSHPVESLNVRLMQENRNEV